MKSFSSSRYSESNKPCQIQHTEYMCTDVVVQIRPMCNLGLCTARICTLLGVLPVISPATCEGSESMKMKIAVYASKLFHLARSHTMELTDSLDVVVCVFRGKYLFG